MASLWKWLARSRAQATAPAAADLESEGFERAYEAGLIRAPWHCSQLDPDVAEALQAHGLAGCRIVDLGTGAGSQAIELARRGHAVTAADFSAAAIDAARRAADESGVTVDFRLDDVTRSGLEGPFDAALDRGCFHVLAPARREDYFSTLRRCLRPEGWLILKCFSTEEPPRPGPWRFSPEDLRGLFEPHFRFVELRVTDFPGARPVPPRALFAVLRLRVV